VDRLKIAQRLAEQRPAGLPPLQLCLQVNISGEASKSGVAPAEVPALAPRWPPAPGLRLRGLMASPSRPATSPPSARRTVPARTAARLNDSGLALDTCPWA
jgi:uncharacterized pyridoxal phosphate-containing UPF0001 family protein